MKICLVTTGQPSTNPRMVKEADLLAAAGHDVTVFGAHWARWATTLDASLLVGRTWKFHYVGGDHSHNDAGYYWTRLRHKAARTLWPKVDRLKVAELACARPAAELAAAARRTPADLYIAHNLGALAPAVSAARRHKARVGFDAEDLYFGMESWPAQRTLSDQLAARLEQAYLPQCDFLLAGSPTIADAYAGQYKGIPKPVPIYNVFPLSHRPAHPPAPRDEQAPVRLYWFSQTIGPYRGLEQAVQAMGQVPEHQIELHLRGDWQAGYQEKLLRLAAECGVPAERIHSYGPAPADQMAVLASDHDVGLALEDPVSQNDDVKISNKICTYLLAGNAVIATATSGQSTLFREIPEAGFLCAPGDTGALAAGLRRWCAQRDQLQRARERAWQYGSSRFHWECEQHRLLAAIEGRDS